MNSQLFLLVLYLFLGFSISLSAAAKGGEATEQLKKSIDKLFAVLKDQDTPSEKLPEEKINKIKGIIEERFNFAEISKRALGRKWNTLNSSQKAEFVTVFKDLLEHSYLHNVNRYSNQEVEYGKERQLAAGKVVIETTVISPNKRIPVHYNLIKKKEPWEVYDIKVEGVSLIKNYRSQFRSALQKTSFEELLADLKVKVKELD